MKNRLIVAAIGIPALLAVIFFTPIWGWGIVVAIMAAFCAWELLHTAMPKFVPRFAVYAGVCGAAIVLGAQLLIDNGTALAQMVGVPDAIIGATMIAIGTSLPELVTTITAIRKKQSSLSVGNIIGANIMDLTLIMPLCALILGKPLPVERQGMLLDIPACLVVCAGALIPALVQGRFKRWVGFFIGGLYIAYLVIMFTCFGA